MSERPYTLLSCGMSMDGYLDNASNSRLLLSNDADFDRVDAVRAECDAILVGAGTVRNDDPRLMVRTPVTARRADRSRAATDTDEGDRDQARGPRPGCELLRHRRHREARLLRQRRAHRGQAATVAGRDGGRRRANRSRCGR